MTSDKLTLSAKCAEQHDQPIAYELTIPFWSKVKEDSVKVEHRPVGKLNFVIDKQDTPARWRYLYDEKSPRPATMKLNLSL